MFLFKIVLASFYHLQSRPGNQAREASSMQRHKRSFPKTSIWFWYQMLRQNLPRPSESHPMPHLRKSKNRRNIRNIQKLSKPTSKHGGLLDLEKKHLAAAKQRIKLILIKLVHAAPIFSPGLQLCKIGIITELVQA